MTLNPERCGNCGECVNCNAEWAAMHEDRLAGRRDSYLRRLGGLAGQAMKTLNLTPERRTLILKTLRIEDTVPSPDSTNQLQQRLREKATPAEERVRAHFSQPHATSPRQQDQPTQPKGLPAPPAPSIGELGERIRARNQK